MNRVAGLVIAVMVLPLAAIASCGGDVAISGSDSLGVWTPGGSPLVNLGLASGSDSGATGSSGGSSGSSSSGGIASPPDASLEPSPPEAGSPEAATPAPPYVWEGGTGTVPCNVATVLAAKCTSCHSDPPIDNSLSGLVTFADLVARAKENPTKNEAQLSVVRMQNASSPMPPASLMMPPTAAEIAALQDWIDAGYPSGQCSTDGGAGDATLTGGGASVFAGQAAFVLGTEVNGHHNPGQDCLSHHHNGEFSIAGTVFGANGAGLAGAEVRVVDSAGTAHVMYSGSNGNFYTKGATTLALGAHAGARNASSTALMISSASGACNSCHATGGVTTPMHLP